MHLSALHIEPTTLLLCDKFPLFAPVCGKFCPSKTTSYYASDKVMGMSSQGVGPTVDAIKQQLFTYGSVNAAFTVYNDFLTYTSGVYQLLVNSWSNLWGDQAGEDTSRLESKTNDCDPADQMCLNSKLVTAYLAELNKCLTQETDSLKKVVTSFRKTYQGDSACIQSLQAVGPENPEIKLIPKQYWDSVAEPVANGTNYHHCKCYKTVVLDALTKWNESRTFMHEEGPLNVGLDNDLLIKKCGIHDWNQLCGAIVFKNSSEDGSIQLDWQEHAQTHFRGRRLLSVYPGNCTGPTSNYNLLKKGVQASQTGDIFYNTNANQGCDGELQKNNPINNGNTKTVRVDPNATGVSFWVANFQQTMNLQSILYIQRSQISNLKFLVGDDDSNNYQNNLPCTGGQLIAGGWLDCGRSGKYLVLISTVQFTFMEVMCYSQYFVHHNALSSTVSSTLNTAATYLCTTSTNCKASNVIRTTLVIWNNSPNSTPCCIYSDTSTDPTLKVTLPADLMIECVNITPSDQGTANTVLTNWQKNIEVSIVNSAGQQQLCGTLSDYNLYTEVPCKKVGNQIIVKRPGSSMTLAMAGASILSNCDCSQSSLNPALIFDAKPLASPTKISTTSTGSSVSITLDKQMADTVSRVCGNADGFTKCGLRTLVFTDKMTGFQITFPYKGFELNYDQSVLTLYPAKATPTTVLTVAVKLDNYPNVTYSQDITAIVEGAVTVVQPLMIPAMILNATIYQEAFLGLPKLEVSQIYFVISKQKFEASIDLNHLKVLSNNETDVGTYNLDLVAIFSSKKVSFEVKVIFTLPKSIDSKTQTYEISNERNTPTTTTRTNGDQAGSITISDAKTETLLETAACIMGEANDISCVGPDGFSFLIDAATGNTVSGDSKIKAQLAPFKLPKFSISNVNTKGQFYLDFSEPVGLEALNIPASQSRKLLEQIQPEERRLKSESGARSSSNSGSQSNHTLLNFLSAKHLNLTIKSKNTTATVFSWHAANITSTQIMIQLKFQDPLFISTQVGVLDKLIVQILPPALIYMRSIATGAMTEDPLRTLSIKLPPQVMPGRAIEIVETSAVILKNTGQTSSISNFVVKTLLAGSMTQMWTMVNSQQIIMSQQQLNLQNPGNVIIVMTKLSDISSFEGVLPTDDILEGIFDFTPTDLPGVGFECMGVDNASVTMYLGMTFLIMILIGLQYLVYCLAYTCRLYDRILSKIEQKLKPGLYFGVFYVFLQESYLDWAVGSALRLEQPKFDTPSDYFDFGLACAGILITLVFPCYCFFFLKKNVDKLDQKDFQSKHAALYEGFTTDNADRRQASMKMAAWFLLRRLLTAVNLVYLRHQTIWIQLTLNMWLSLTDICFKIHLSPYENKVDGFMQKFNDLFVLTCAYYPYLFTDLIPSPEDKYFIGWFYDGTVGTMIAVNLFIIVRTAFHDIINKIREMKFKDKIQKATKAQNENRKKQEKMLKLWQSGIVEGLTNEKPRAIQFQNELHAIHELSLKQFLAIKRMERQERRDASLAKQLQREMDEGLDEVPEVDEENQGSNRSVRNNLEAQIHQDSQLLTESKKFGQDKKVHQKQALMFEKKQMMFTEMQQILTGRKNFERQKEEQKQQPWDVKTHIMQFSQEQKDQENQKRIAQVIWEEIKQREFIRKQQQQKIDDEFNDFWRNYKQQSAIEREFFQEERKEINKSYLQREAQMLSQNQSERFKHELYPDWKTSDPNWRLKFLTKTHQSEETLQLRLDDKNK